MQYAVKKQTNKQNASQFLGHISKSNITSSFVGYSKFKMDTTPGRTEVPGISQSIKGERRKFLGYIKSHKNK